MRMRAAVPEGGSGEGKGGMSARLLGFMAACAVLAAPAARGQTTALESWREAVASRWEFQHRFPAAH